MKKLSLKLKIYFISIYLITLIFIFYSAFNNFLPITYINYIDGLFFIILVAITESFSVPFQSMSFSTSFSIELASYILFGPFISLLIIILGFSARVLKVKSGYKHILNTPIYGTLFNYCIFVLSILSSNYIYLQYGGSFSIDKLSSNVFQIILFCMVFFIVNNIIISSLSSVMFNKNITYVFISNIRLMILNILVMAPFGIVVAFVFNLYSYGGVFLVLVPIVLAKYTFSLYIQTKSQYVETIDALMLAMEARDRYTEGHSKRVAEISAVIAKELKYSQLKIEQLNMAALLHDVGKIGIDDCILNKPGKLTKEEFDTIKTHPQIGYNILKDIKNLENILPIIRNHHERYDGTGYPDGKSAEELGLDVFIVQLADSIDAMSTDRPYRKALHPDVVVEEVKKYSGTQFHPKVVEAYFKVLEKQKK
ncbi:HD-GYP domain-containing protein [Clostridium estertheticum]|uniref:HD-GYP domain-containing protein n=1 Tax=Clostridium estertheticum TaxID=238834 RepID=UPI0013E8FDFF|nr:HD-GYP domain-containing protein [Clostridium estertheticum]MBZ9685344.1 HD-GYP domain-containing protein [Clostridium estertheticum]